MASLMGNSKSIELEFKKVGDLELERMLKDSRVAGVFKLQLPGNHLTRIDSICSFTSLKVLNLGYNQIQQLPVQISRLCSLTELNLQHNRISSFPFQITTLSKLEAINIKGNLLPSKYGMELKYDEKFGETFSKVWKNEYWEEDVVDLIQALGKTSSDLSKQRQFVYKAVQMLLRSLAEYYGVKPKDVCRKCALLLIWGYRESDILKALSKDVIKLIAMYVYSTRKEDCWVAAHNELQKDSL